MSLSVTLSLPDEHATETLAARLAALARPGDIFALAGPLGSGKTTLARAFIRALTGPEEEVPSPTFTLVQSYDSAKGPLFHFDLYRLESPDQAEELGIDDAFADGISLVEWPERLGRLLPARHLRVALAAGPEEGGRIASISGGEAWAQRWQ
jgi:tRNA threonylcarbamoyladenosine biosynthesis protein TsaE